MLVHGRRLLEKVRIGDDVVVAVARIGDDVVVTVDRIGVGQVRVGVDAPRRIRVLRSELVGRSRRDERSAAAGTR